MSELISFALENPFGLVLGLLVAASVIGILYAVIAADAEGR